MLVLEAGNQFDDSGLGAGPWDSYSAAQATRACLPGWKQNSEREVAAILELFRGADEELMTSEAENQALLGRIEASGLAQTDREAASLLQGAQSAQSAIATARQTLEGSFDRWSRRNEELQLKGSCPNTDPYKVTGRIRLEARRASQAAKATRGLGAAFSRIEAQAQARQQRAQQQDAQRQAQQAELQAALADRASQRQAELDAQRQAAEAQRTERSRGEELQLQLAQMQLQAQQQAEERAARMEEARFAADLDAQRRAEERQAAAEARAADLELARAQSEAAALAPAPAPEPDYGADFYGQGAAAQPSYGAQYDSPYGPDTQAWGPMTVYTDPAPTGQAALVQQLLALLGQGGGQQTPAGYAPAPQQDFASYYGPSESWGDEMFGLGAADLFPWQQAELAQARDTAQGDYAAAYKRGDLSQRGVELGLQSTAAAYSRGDSEVLGREADRARSLALRGAQGPQTGVFAKAAPTDWGSIFGGVAKAAGGALQAFAPRKPLRPLRAGPSPVMLAGLGLGALALLSALKK